MYDIIIIGAGSGGLNIAVFMATSGFKVLLIDTTDKNIGGDCLNNGCVPSKSFIHIAREIAIARNVERYGVTSHGDVDLASVMQSVQDKIGTIRKHENAEYFRSLGMDVVLGHAAFSGNHEVTVDNVAYQGKKIVLATGSRPRKLLVDGVKDAHLITNEDVFSLTTLPKNLVVIGVGPIGLELGQAFSMLGSSVTFIGNEPRILPREKEEFANVLRTTLSEQGVTFRFTSEIVRIEHGNTLWIKDKVSGVESSIFFDTALVAIGRQLNVENLGLEYAGIAVLQGKIIVDEYLRTTNKDVYLCGDIAGGYQFTHAAELHAKVLLNNFFNPLIKKKISYDTFSWVTYTTPEIATFGLSEKILMKRGTPFETLTTTFTEDDRAITNETTKGKSEVYVHSRLRTILGGT